MTTVAISGTYAKLLETWINERDQLTAKEEQIQSILLTTAMEKNRLQGKCDGLIEIIAGELDYDFKKIEKYDANTDERTVILTFKQEDPVEHSKHSNGEGTKAAAIGALREEVGSGGN